MKYLVVAAALCFGAALARPDGAGHSHDHGHDHAAAPSAPQAPSSGYSAAAASGYSAPGQGYEQPSAYAAPSTGYEQPAAGYEQPYDQSYAAPTSYGQSYDAAPVAAAPAAGPNLGLIIIPLLIVAGLALLFPSTTLVTVRRKRDTEGESSPNSLMERVQDIYASVVESEECLERVACEVGGLAEDMGVNKSMFSVAEPFVPTKYSKFVKKFASGKDCHKIKCGSLF